MKLIVNNINIKSDKIYDTELFNEDNLPYINSDMVDKSDLYTFIIVDKDAPYPSSPIHKYFIHLLVINNKQIILDYTPPNPPENSLEHTYFILLFKQNNKITLSNIINSRPGFDLNAFIKKYDLKQVDKFKFKVIH